MSATKHSKAVAEVAMKQDCTFACTCGRVHLVENVLHWQKYILSCGKRVWALQPRRNGPLELRPLPDPKPGERWTITQS